MTCKTNKGFIALISVLMISLVLFFSVVSLGNFALSSRFSLLDVEHKIQSEKLAEACGEIAIAAVINNSLLLTFPQNISIDENECTIVSITKNTPDSGKVTVETKAIIFGATTNLRLVHSLGAGLVVSYEQLESL